MVVALVVVVVVVVESNLHYFVLSWFLQLEQVGRLQELVTSLQAQLSEVGALPPHTVE